MKLLLLLGAMYTLNPVTISVYPAFSLPPATFRITVLVPRHLENRNLCFGVSGPEDKKSCMTLDGWTSRRSWTVYWDLRTVGEYEAKATLTRITEGKEKHLVATATFRVTGLDPDEPPVW